MTGNNWWAPATSSIAPPCFKVLTREAAGGHGRGSEWSACRPLLWLRWLTKWPGRSDNSPGATVPPVQNEDIEMGEDLLCSFLPTCSATLSTFLSSRLQFLKTWDLHGFIFSLYHNFLSFISFCSVFFFSFFHLIEWSTPRVKASNPGLGQAVGRNKATGAVKPSSNWPKKSSWCSNRKSSPRSHPNRFCFWDPLFPKRHLASIRKRVCQEHHHGHLPCMPPTAQAPFFLGTPLAKPLEEASQFSLLPALT